MLTAYFKNKALQSEKIKHKNELMKRVISALKSVEESAIKASLSDVPLSSFQCQKDLDDWYHEHTKIKHQKYLAVRLQREKIEQIQKYLTTYQDFLHNALCLNLFYAQSYSELTDNLPDPKTDLEGYINGLVTNMTQNAESDDIATQRQLYIGLLLSLVSLSVLIISLTILSITLSGLILMALSVLCLPPILSTSLLLFCDQITKHQRLDLIKNDCVQTIPRHNIKIGTIQSDIRHGGILLYCDPYYKKIMCSIMEPTVYKETFELKLTDTTQHALLTTTMDSSTPVLSASLKDAVFDAIKKRTFSRALPHELRKQPSFSDVINGEPQVLKQLFFKTPKEQNAFSAEAVQQELMAASQTL